MLCVIVPEILAIPVGSRITISGCPSASRLFESTFSELEMVENIAFATRITVIPYLLWSYSSI